MKLAKDIHIFNKTPCFLQKQKPTGQLSQCVSIVCLEMLLSLSPFNLIWILFFMHNKEMNTTQSIRG